MAENFIDNGYNFEEKDDPRTSTGELIQDIERPAEKPFKEEVSSDEVPIDLLLLEYVAEFRGLIDACGQTSYFWNMMRFVADKVKKAEDIAAAYQHDSRYYNEQFREWAAKAKRSYVILGLQAGRLGYKMPVEKDFLNNLTLYKDRRECYRYYLDNYLKKGMTFSPDELEEKYKARIAKRAKKK